MFLYMLEAKIYCWTDIFSELRLQRSMHSSNCARSSEQQDMLGVGEFQHPKLLQYVGIENNVLKYMVKQHVTSLPPPPKRKD